MRKQQQSYQPVLANIRWIPFLISFQMFNTIEQSGWEWAGVFLKATIIPEPNQTTLRCISETPCWSYFRNGGFRDPRRQKNMKALKIEVSGLLLLVSFNTLTDWCICFSGTAPWTALGPVGCTLLREQKGLGLRCRKVPGPHASDCVQSYPHTCSWVAEEWEHCPKTCGTSGYQLRTVRCLQPLHDGTNRSVHSKYCVGERPESRRPCNRVPCPAQWKTGPWNEVGVWIPRACVCVCVCMWSIF